MRALILIASIIFLPAILFGQDFVTLTNLQGRKIEAKILRMERGKVDLHIKGKGRYKIKISDLSEESQKVIKKILNPEFDVLEHEEGDFSEWNIEKGLRVLIRKNDSANQYPVLIEGSEDNGEHYFRAKFAEKLKGRFDYKWSVLMKPSEFSRKNKRYIKDGWELSGSHTFKDSKGNELVQAVWVENDFVLDSDDAVYTEFMPYKQFRKRYDEEKENHRYAVAINLTEIGNQFHYRGIFKDKPKSGRFGWSSTWGSDDKAFEKKNKRLLGEGYELIHHSQYTSKRRGNKVYHQAVWVKQAN